MIQEEKKEESLVDAVAPDETNVDPVSASAKIDFTLHAEEYQGHLRLTATGTKIPYSLYMEVYPNGFPSNPGSEYIKEMQITKRTQVFDTKLDWGSGYSCAIILKTYDSTNSYEYICKLST